MILNRPRKLSPQRPCPTTEFLQEGLTIAIPTVVGAGNLEMEYVQILNQSDGAINLNGWQVQNGRGQQFTFPAMILNRDGAVEVHSKAGTNTVIELYWQSDTPFGSPVTRSPWSMPAGKRRPLIKYPSEIINHYAQSPLPQMANPKAGMKSLVRNILPKHCATLSCWTVWRMLTSSPARAHR